MTVQERNLEKFLECVNRRTQRDKVRREAEEYAQKFWKLLLEKVGDSEAKEIMRHLMGDKKAGPRRTEEDVALSMFIFGYLLHFGLDHTDAKIAEHIFESKPCYLQLESGAIVVSNNADFSATYSFTDDPIVGRRPINMTFPAIKKQVERHRRSAIKEERLPKTYAQRPYQHG